MAEIWIMGEMLVEIMRTQEDVPLGEPGLFKGPFPSGAPAIFIDTVARLGHKAGIIGGVGKDDFGKNILDRLQRDGVDTSLVLESGTCATGTAFVTYFKDGSRKFIYHMGNTPAVEAKMPPEKALEGIRCFHMMGCSLMAKPEFAEEILKTMKLAKKMGATISFDPNIRKELFTEEAASEIINEVAGCTNILLPGVEELLLITGAETIDEAVRKSFENENLDILALKNGSKGCTVYTREQSVTVKAYTVDQVDATGAGDCFDGAFICGVMEGRTIEEAARMAAAAGALNAASFGPMEGKISRETIEKMIG